MVEEKLKSFDDIIRGIWSREMAEVMIKRFEKEPDITLALFHILKTHDFLVNKTSSQEQEIEKLKGEISTLRLKYE